MDLYHNNLVVLDPTSNFLRTVNRSGDVMTGDGNRIGDENNLRGISLEMMIELNV